MKFLTLLTLFFAANVHAAPTTWIDENAQIVNVMPTSVLMTQLLETKISAENWALLQYEWNYSIPDYQVELDGLKKAYPGFKIARAKMDAASSHVEMLIRPLDLRAKLDLKQGIEGAYGQGTVVLTKAQYQQLRSAKIAPDAAFALTGEVTVNVTKAVVKERIPLNAQVCERMTLPGRTARTLIENLARAVGELERRPEGLRDGDRDAWLKGLLDNCYADPGLTWVRTLRDVLNVELEVNSRAVLKDYVRVEESLVQERTAPTWIWRGSHESVE